MKHKLLTLLLVIIASVGTMFAQSGTCGNNLTWNLTNGVLTISGSGNMYPYNPPDEEDSQHLVAPWVPYRQSITSVVILEGVISIGSYAFGECKNLTSVSIPNSVTSIGSYAFYYCTGLTSIEIPNSVTSIGWWAFYNCTGLTSVTIPNSVTSIEQETFKYCSALVSVTIPNSVTSIGTGAFQNCIGLTSVTIPNSVTSIENWAFASCSSLTSITIPVNVKNIGYSAFENCTGLTAVNISDLNAWCNISFSTLDSNPLYYAKNLYLKGVLVQELILPNSVTSIGERSFAGCSMTSVTIPNSVNSIGNYAFEGCSGLTSVAIGNSVTSIGTGAFQNCIGLTSVTIPNSVTSIGNSAFAYCSGLTSVTNYATTPQTITTYVFRSVNISSCKLNVPAGSVKAYKNAPIWRNFGTIQAIEGDTPCTPISGTCGGNLTWELSCDSVLTISGTGAMTDFNSTSDNPWYGHRNAIKSVIIGDGITSIGKGAFYNCSVLTSVTIGNSVKSIEQGAFQNCSVLPSIVIPNSVTSIEYGAFKGCTVLSSVTIGNSIKSLGDYAFENCSSLNSVTIPNSVTSIGYGAFGNCSGLASVTIGNSLTSIGNFAFYNCSGLTSVTNYATTPQTIDEYVFGSVDISSCTLQVPAGTVTAYKAASVWKDFGTIQAISGDTPCTPISGTCGGNLTWKLSCDSVLTVSGTGAMADYTSSSSAPWYEHRNDVKSVLIDNNVTSIGNYAFRNCTSLTSVEIPNSVTSIGASAFYGCSSLVSVTIPNSVTSIGNRAFRNCSGLTSMTIPSSVTSIGEDAFLGCSGLTYIIIESETPPTLNTLKYGVFDDKNDCPIYVPCSAVNAYKSAWAEYAARIVASTNCTIRYTVTFKDWDCTVLKTEQVEEGHSATPPANPTREGYTFTGWDKDFSYVQSDLIVSALYQNNNIISPFVGFEYTRSHTLADQIYSENLIQNINNVWLEEMYPKYAIHLIEPIEGGTFTMGGVIFFFNNSNPDKVGYRTYVQYIQPCLTSCEIRIPTVAGLHIKFTLVEACDSISVNGEIRDFVAGDNIITATGAEIIIKYMKGKPKISAIIPYNSIANTTYYTVTFKDWDGTILKKQQVEKGYSASAPAAPTREGYTFVGWDKDFSNVHSNMSIYALYEPNNEGIEDAQSDQVQNTKILRNGQIFIQRGEKIYTITGQEIQSY